MVSPGYLAFHADPKKPDQPLPANACDAHCHVFGPQAVYPFAPSSTYEPVDAGKEILFQRHQFLGVDRAVVVQASCHGTDNSAMLDALKSGLFEGEIRSASARLHPNRKSFVMDEALAGFCASVCEWYLEVAKGYVDQAKELQADQRWQRLE